MVRKHSALAHNDAHDNINTLINTNTKSWTVITETIVYKSCIKIPTILIVFTSGLVPTVTTQY